ncbi:hypothetical protein PYW07_008270 [Mythimna separata]|uniref:Peptidase S1 domain-containing protein n=1 Tax=Mythimna separata TaxID=271217 RepID=A0AAD7YDE8_MYTSE|nr:hypothetical protein PYW07_008270 [Mythimna separata]
MFKKSSLLLFVLTILQVSARYQSGEPDVKLDPVAVSASSSRIENGWAAKPGQHPHHATISMLNSTGGIQLCGGSIISKEWVVTAAPCTVGRVLAVVRVGVLSINDNNPASIFETTEWYNHPMYNNLSASYVLQSHGVTLLKLQRPIIYNRLVQRIRVQSSAHAYRNYDGQLVYTSGYLRISSRHDPTFDVLRWTFFRAITETECRRTHTTSVHNTTICSRYYEGKRMDPCYDSLGGPLVHVESDGIPTLIGINYFMPVLYIGCEAGQTTGSYRPGYFLPWFKEVTGIDFENLQEEDEDDTTVADTTVTATVTTNTPTTLTTPTTITTPINTTSSTTTTLSSTPVSEDQDLEDFTPEDDITSSSEDTGENEVEEDPDSSQLPKNREVNVNVKVLTNIKQM